MIGARFTCGGATAVCTVTENAGSEVDVLPSVTLTSTPAVVPTSDVVGDPAKVPVRVSKVAQEGRFWIANTRGSPSASLPDGWNRYDAPTTTVVDGTPEIEGGEFAPGAMGADGVVGVDGDSLPV